MTHGKVHLSPRLLHAVLRESVLAEQSPKSEFVDDVQMFPSKPPRCIRDFPDHHHSLPEGMFSADLTAVKTWDGFLAAMNRHSGCRFRFAEAAAWLGAAVPTMWQTNKADQCLADIRRLGAGSGCGALPPLQQAEPQSRSVAVRSLTASRRHCYMDIKMALLQPLLTPLNDDIRALGTQLE